MLSRFTELVGCALPLQQAGMGGVGTPELAAAVSEAGALGTVSGSAADAVAAVEAARALTTRPLAVNFLVPFLDRAALEAVAPRVRLVELFWGEPDGALVEAIHDAGALAGWQVGDGDEARRAADAGCDVIVAQGVEAGGHVRGTTPLLPLLDEVLDAVDVAVVAAGGIGTSRAVAAVLAAGADAARVGTRFVAARESAAHPAYVDALVAAGPRDTVLTTTFSRFWPDAPHRVLRSCVEGPPERDLLPPTRDHAGDVAHMALYAGQSVGAVRRTESAADIVGSLVPGTVPRPPG